MTQPKLKVAVTGFGGFDVPHPGAGVARALREGWRGGIEIHALGYDAFMTGAWIPEAAEELHTLPPLSAGDGPLLARLVALAGRFGFDALIPTLDLEVPVFARLADRLEAVGIKTLLPPVDSVYATSKLRLAKHCHDHAIPTPRTIHVLDMGDLTLHADQFGYPHFVKGSVAGAKRVFSPEQAQTEAAALVEKWNGGVLLQEIVDGEEFNVAAVIGRDGKILSLVSIRKVGVNEKGKGVLCTVVDDPEIEKHARSVLSTLAWRGAIELEFVRPSVAKIPSLIEINCRFPAWIMLSHWAGCNLPVTYLQEILGGPRRRTVRPKPGTSFVRDVVETAVPRTQIEALMRFGTSSGTAASLRRNRRDDSDAIRVAVSGVSTYDVVNAGLGVARALRMVPHIGSIYGLGYGTFDSGLYRPELFDSAYRLQVSEQPEALFERVRAIHAATPFDVLIPCLDGEILRFIEIRDALGELGVKTLLPSRAAFERRSKPCLFTDAPIARYQGFDVPETLSVRSEKDIERALEKLGTPVVLKGAISHAIPAENLGEARAAWDRLHEKGYAEALVQAFVEGERFAVAAVCDARHQAVSAMTIKKLRVCDRGSTWSAGIVAQPALEAGFAAYLRALEWVGPVEGEFIRDKMTERFQLIEVNPRFTAWIVFSAHLGLNHPYAAVRCALGLPVETHASADDLVFMRACEDAPLSNSAFAAIATKGVLRHG